MDDFRKQYRRFLTSKRWKDLRVKIFKQKNGRCQRCNRLITSSFVINHIEEVTPFNLSKEFVFNEKNLELLCFGCHSIETNLGTNSTTQLSVRRSNHYDKN